MLFYIFKTSLVFLNFQRAASTWTFVDKYQTITAYLHA